MARSLSSHRAAIAALGLASAAATMVASVAAAGPASAAPAPEKAIHVAAGATPVAGSYIVVLNDKATASSSLDVAVHDLAANYGGSNTLKHTYRAALNGFAATMTATEANKLAQDPRVAYVEQDSVVHADTTQSNATWGLDRIDQRNLPLSTTYTFTATAANVHAYIIDTGIRITHNDFGGRASVAFDAIGDGRNGIDCNGHGTHVSGTVGGATWGVAKAVRLHAVRVLNCSGSGTTAGVIAGVDFVTANAIHPAVANMSLGGGVSTALDNAVTRSINSGVTYAIAAGNSNANACNSSPARAAAAITVAATGGTTGRSDARASFSNFGTCVDIFGPGVQITSAWMTSNTATNTISGTSMATPHVAGVAALILSGNPGASPATVRTTMVNLSTPNVVTNPGTGSPNRLLFTNL